MKNKRTPEIRFPEFTGDWEQRKFHDFTILSQGLQIAIDKRHLVPGENRIFYITNEFLNPNSDKRYYIESPSKNVVAGKEDILMTRTGNTGKVVTNVEGAFHNNFFKVAYNNKKTEKLFLYYLLNSFPIQREILVRAGTSTIPDLNHNDFYKIKVNTPSFEEQTKIGNFFRQLDETISLYQQELTTLKQSKYGFLQKMFPKEGESVPEVRFPGFTGDWKQRKLGEILKVNSGRDYKHLHQGNIPVYGTGGYMLSVNDKLSDENAIGIGRKGTINKPQLLKAPFWTVDTLFYMTTKEKNDLLFCYSLANKINWKKYDESTGVPSLSKSSIDKIPISIPTPEEQSKIGNFFKQLDDTIALYQHELDTLKETKKAFLKKMFV